MHELAAKFGNYCMRGDDVGMAALMISRVVTFAIVVAMTIRCSPQTFFDTLFVIAMAHYILSVVYSAKSFKSALKSPRRFIPLAALVGAAVAMWEFGFSLVLLFLPHHIFNEVYCSKNEMSARGIKVDPALITSGLTLHAFIFMRLAAMEQFGPIPLNDDVVTAGMIISAGWFAGALWSMKSELRNFWFFAVVISSEVVSSIALSIQAGTLRNYFYQLILFHVVFWIFYPLTKQLGQRDFGGAGRYVAANIAALAFAFAISPLSPLAVHCSSFVWHQLFFLFSMVHIMMSFAASRANPMWVIKLTQGAATATTVKSSVPVVEKIAQVDSRLKETAASR